MKPNRTHILNVITRKYFVILMIASMLFACDTAQHKEEYDEIDYELQEIFNMQPGDSIPLDLAIQKYDSLSFEKNSSIIEMSDSLKTKLDSLKSELLLDSENDLLKFEIKNIESILEETALIDKMMEDIDLRDAEIKRILSESDSIP